MKPYRLLLFDADGTLFDYELAEETALRNTFRKFGMAWDRETHLSLYRRINLALWAELEQGGISPTELRERRFGIFFAEMNTPPPEVDFGRTYLEELSCGSMLIDGALETVQALAPHFRLAILSNGLAEVQKPRFAASELDRFFPVRVISGELGLVKPDTRIFAHALDLCGITEKSDVLMIGDSPTSDLAGANAFGIDSCWYAPVVKQLPQGVRPTYTIHRLTELPSLLGIH
jgi:2-haloacid dehalogenase